MSNLNIEKLKVQSFVTTLNNNDNNTIKGGYLSADCNTNEPGVNCNTDNLCGGDTNDCGGGGGTNACGGGSDYAQCQSLLHACYTERLDPNC